METSFKTGITNGVGDGVEGIFTQQVWVCSTWGERVCARLWPGKTCSHKADGNIRGGVHTHPQLKKCAPVCRGRHTDGHSSAACRQAVTPRSTNTGWVSELCCLHTGQPHATARINLPANAEWGAQGLGIPPVSSKRAKISIAVRALTSSNLLGSGGWRTCSVPAPGAAPAGPWPGGCARGGDASQRGEPYPGPCCRLHSGKGVLCVTDHSASVVRCALRVQQTHGASVVKSVSCV